MSCETEPVAQCVDPKRPGENVPIQFDWHDYLANVWRPGVSVAAGHRIRFTRIDPRSKGLEYECTTAGKTAGRPPFWPRTPGETVQDGSVTWTARALSPASLRALIDTSEFPLVSGVSISDAQSDDLRYTVWVSGGTAGSEYEIVQRVTLSGALAERKEAAVRLPVIG